MADDEFRRWMRRVDSILLAKCGMTSMDLGDIDYRDLFDAGENPAFAAKEALDENGGGELW